jgi:hypothetical protein
MVFQAFLKMNEKIEKLIFLGIVSLKIFKYIEADFYVESN